MDVAEEVEDSEAEPQPLRMLTKEEQAGRAKILFPTFVKKRIASNEARIQAIIVKRRNVLLSLNQKLVV